MEKIEELRKENKELKEQLEMIEYFYEENSLIKRIKFFLKYIKEKRKNGNNTDIRNNDTSRNNTIFNNSNDNSGNNEIDSLFNDKEIKK